MFGTPTAHQKQKGHLSRCPKLLILKVAWDRIELPTRGFSVFSSWFTAIRSTS
jgi:hypothetical protein